VRFACALAARAAHTACAPHACRGAGARRLADASHTASAEASAALGIALPILVEQGLQWRTASVRDAAVGALAAVVAVAAPRDIAPQLAQLVAGLLEALSSLEAPALAAAEMELAGRRGLDTSALDEARVRLASKTPLHAALDTCGRLVDASSAPAVSAALAALFTSGAPPP
jgi:hypothetical protein